MRNNLKFIKFYNDALSRLTPLEREINLQLEYKYSLYALAEYFFKLADSWPKAQDNKINKIIIAVSGGGDSVALLWLMRAFYPGEVIAAHVNHCIRGLEADQDERFVKDFAAELNLKFISVKINVPELKLKAESLEEAARRLRYEWLIENANKFDACGIALGHNRDDLAETVLFNILRGTGIRGSVGIPERRGLFFRPLLGLSRDFLREILRARNISWREDSTNQDVNISSRNFIRLELMPLIAFMVLLLGAMIGTNPQTLFHIANANFVRFTPDKFMWWRHVRIAGVIIQVLACEFVVLVAAAKMAPENFLGMLANKKKSILVFLMSVMVIAGGLFLAALI